MHFMPAESDEPQRILIVRPSALGDVARTVPALVSLRRAFPDARIDWLVRASFADAVRHHPDLNEVVEFPRKRFVRFGRSVEVTREVFQWLGELKARRYDHVYDLQGLVRSGLFTYAARAPVRVGFANAPELAWLGYNRRHRIEWDMHTVDRMLGLLEAEDIEPVRDMRLHVGEDDRRWAEQWLADRGIEPERYLVLAPTAMWLSKRWPAARFGEIAQRIADRRPAGADFHAGVVVGSPGEDEQARPVLQRHWTIPLHDMVGRTTVGRLMALIEQCGLVLCNDSAALHLAVGLGRRCLGVFGPTEPQLVGPYRYELGVARADGGESVHYRAAWLDQDLIASLDVEVVWEQVQRVLNAPPPPTVLDDEKT